MLHLSPTGAADIESAEHAMMDRHVPRDDDPTRGARPSGIDVSTLSVSCLSVSRLPVLTS